MEKMEEPECQWVCVGFLDRSENEIFGEDILDVIVLMPNGAIIPTMVSVSSEVGRSKNDMDDEMARLLDSEERRRHNVAW
jgi:hypothetical protein